MRTWIRTGSLSGWLIGSLAFTACTADTSTTGDLAIELALLDGTRIDEVAWVIRRVGMEPMAGIVNTSAPGATASVEVFGIPPATGYTVSMTATSADGETSCSGSADFEVALGAVTEVTVTLNCKPGSELGGVRVDGRLNICADLVKVVVAPLQTSVGSEFRVSSRAEDAEGDAIQYRWTGTGGTFANPNAPETTYTCRELGEQSITITVSDDGFEYCDRNWTVDIHCVDRGSGGTGGTGGIGGPGAQEKELSLGCSNSSPIGAQSILSALLRVDPSPISASSDFDAELSGSATFPELFLDAAQMLVIGGLRQVTLRELEYIAQVRSGATLVSGSAGVPGVPLGPDASMLNPGLVRLCNFPPDQTCTIDSDCVGMVCNEPVIMIDVPTSEDCAPGGMCDALGKADGAQSQCGLNGFCVTGPLEIPLLPATANYRAEASGDVLFGWADQGLDNSTFNPMTQLFTISKSTPITPIEQGVSVDAGLAVSIECVMGVDAGPDPNDGGNSLVGLTRDGALISFTIAE